MGWNTLASVLAWVWSTIFLDSSTSKVTLLEIPQSASPSGLTFFFLIISTCYLYPLIFVNSMLLQEIQFHGIVWSHDLYHLLWCHSHPRLGQFYSFVRLMILWSLDPVLMSCLHAYVIMLRVRQVVAYGTVFSSCNKTMVLRKTKKLHIPMQRFQSLSPGKSILKGFDSYNTYKLEVDSYHRRSIF